MTLTLSSFSGDALPQPISESASTAAKATDKHFDYTDTNLEKTEITVYVDNEEASFVTKNLTSTRIENGLEYTLTLTNFGEGSRQDGKQYKEWSGNVTIDIDAGQIYDTSDNKNEVVEQMAGSFIDNIKPEFTYVFDESDISYDDKKLKIVPRKRFPQFESSEAWNELTLIQLSDRITDKVGTEKLTTLSITAGVGFVSQAEKFDRDISGNQYRNYIRIKKGDFSYNKGNSKKFPQGCIYELNEYEEAAVPNAFISFRFHDDVVSDFYKGYFENNFHGIQLAKHITSGARSNGLLNINSDDFFNIILPTPNETAEQQKIADCLVSLDDLIYAEKNKLDTLQKHKNGLMQKFFPSFEESFPKLRFKEFCDKKIDFKNGDELFEPISNKDHKCDLPVLAISQEHGAIPREKIDYNVFVSDKSLVC